MHHVFPKGAFYKRPRDGRWWTRDPNGQDWPCVLVGGKWLKSGIMRIPPKGLNDVGLLQDLADRGVISGYNQYVLGLEPLLEGMGAKGMPVNPQRHAEVTAELLTRADGAEGAMQAFIPDDVRAHSPKCGYKKPPKDVETNPIYTKRWFASSYPVVGIDPKIPLGQQEERWVKLTHWSPSHAGLIRYMKYRGHAVPTDYKTGKPTTEEAEIVRLMTKTGDPLYAAVVTQRQIGTILNNHMKNWTPGADGRVHPTFYYDTGTGQLAARRPNTMNAPKHGQDAKKELADMFRSMVIAEEGNTLVELDYKSFHAQTLAFEAQDADYLRLAKLDIHSYLTAHLIRHPDRDRLLGFDDAELGERLTAIKKEHRFIRDFKAKRAILGYGFGMGYRKLYNLYREAFDGQNDAKRTIDMLNGLFPRANAWRDEVRQKAHDQGYLISRFGCIRWFWEVFRWQGGEWKPGGDDSESAIAFLPANDAFCHIKNAMLELAPTWGQYQINQIHDSLMYEVPLELADTLVREVAEVMERPSPVLVGGICPGGLSVEVGVSVGKSWDQMKEITWKQK